MVDLLKLDILVQGAQVDSAAKKLDVLSVAARGVDLATSRMISTVGKLVAAYATWSVVESIVHKFITSTEEAEKAQQQLATAVQATGGKAGYSVDQLMQLATGLEHVTAYGDEAVEGAQALLLTFTRVGHDTFPRATEAVLDMATALGMDLDSAARLVGRALNDPIKGVSSLSRTVGTFDASERAAIKSMVEHNNVAGAQALILDKLEGKFGGAAQAARGTLGGALSALDEAFGDLFESTGSGSDQLRGSVESLIKTFQDPQFIQAVQGFGSLIFGMITMVANGISATWGQLKSFLSWLQAQANTGHTASAVEAQLEQEKAALAKLEADRDANNATFAASQHDTSLGGFFNGMGAVLGNTLSGADKAIAMRKQGIASLEAQLAKLNQPGNIPNLPVIAGGATGLVPKSGGGGGGVDLTDDQIKEMERQAKAYDQLTLSMKQKTATSMLEQQSIGLSADAVTQLTNRQDVLQAAESKGIALDSMAADGTRTKRQELVGYADQLTATEIATRRLSDAYSTDRDIFKGFFSDMADNQRQGQGFWESVANAGIAALNKLEDKMIDLVTSQAWDALWSGGGQSSGATGGVANWISTLLGGLFGGGSGATGSAFTGGWGAAGLHAAGGYISGSGTGTSDSIAARLSNGEFVVNAASTAVYRPQLEAINARFASGGFVGPAANSNLSAPSVSIVFGDINLQGSSGNAVQDDAYVAKVVGGLRTMVRKEVLDAFDRQSRIGGRLNQVA
jgi:hypothetical protein